MRKSRLSKAKQKVRIRHIKQLVKSVWPGCPGQPLISMKKWRIHLPSLSEPQSGQGKVERGVFSQARRRTYAFV